MATLLRTALNERCQNAQPADVVFLSVGATVVSMVTVSTLLSKSPTEWRDYVLTKFIRMAKVMPGLSGAIEEEQQKIVDGIVDGLRIKGDFASFLEIPEEGKTWEQVLELTKSLRETEGKWEDGKVSGCVYNVSHEHHDLMSKVYGQFSHTNPLHPDVFPEIRKMEAEVVSMTSKMLNGGPEVCGALTAGGTESILMAIKSYRDRARIESNITKPEIVCCVSAHAAFHKACHYFGIKLVNIPCGADYGIDVAKAAKAVNSNTILVVGSAPSFPHGVVDDIKGLAEIARKHNIGLHVDCCLGGFVLPWGKKLGYNIPDFDFSIKEVTSISCDSHKYGYATKGTSVVMYANKELRKHMYYVNTEWTGGMYCSPTMAGSRPGALIACCWAAMLSLGKNGYMDASKSILDEAKKIKEGIKNIPGIKLVGDSHTMVVAFASDDLDIFKVMEGMTRKGWSLNALQKPSSIHLCVTLAHIGKADVFLGDLSEVTQAVKTNPKDFSDGMAPVYGMAASLPDRGSIAEFVTTFLDCVLDPNI